MADITDIKTILYTEKSLGLQEQGVVVIQTSPSMTKNGLKAVLKDYFGITPLRVNSLRMDGRIGVRNDFKKFYVKLPEGATLESAEA